MRAADTIRLKAILAALLLVSGCTAFPPTKPIRVGGLVFHNNTRQPLQDVRLQVPKTGGFMACNAILTGLSCATTFPARHYRGTPVVVSWQQAGEQFTSGKIQLRPGGKPVPGKPATVTVTINSDNSVIADIE